MTGGTNTAEGQAETPRNIAALALVKKANAPSNIVTRAFEGQQDAPKDAAIRALSIEVESPIRSVEAVLTCIYRSNNLNAFTHDSFLAEWIY
jgi:hypothetical protein